MVLCLFGDLGGDAEGPTFKASNAAFAIGSNE